MKSEILGHSVEASTLKVIVDEIDNLLRSDVRQCQWVACLNPHSYAISRKSPDFAKALKQADWLVPDGSGIVLAGRALGRPVAARITGHDIFLGVMNALNRQAGRVFFLGATNETLELIKQKVLVEFPRVDFAGYYSPPFRDSFCNEETDQMLDAIAQAQPDVLWVGMTAPKQEQWIAHNKAKLPVIFTGAIGAVFDFYAGTVRRPSPIFHYMHLEWLPRLLREPKRLWRRTFISGPIFIYDVIRAFATR